MMAATLLVSLRVLFSSSAAALPNYSVNTVSLLGAGGQSNTVTVDPTTQRLYVHMAGYIFTVHLMDTSGALSTVAGNVATGQTDGMGSYATLSSKIFQISFCRSNGVDIIYMADSDNNLVRAMTTDGRVSTIAGGGGSNAAGFTNDLGTYAMFNNPGGVACDSSSGDVWVVDTGNSDIRKIAYGTKTVTTVAGQSSGGAVINGIGTNARFGNSMRHITHNPKD